MRVEVSAAAVLVHLRGAHAEQGAIAARRMRYPRMVPLQ